MIIGSSLCYIHRIGISVSQYFLFEWLVTKYYLFLAK